VADISLFACAILFSAAGNRPVHAQELDQASTLPDLSGLAWVADDLFIGIHDAKRNSEKFDWPRVSLVHLPKSELQGTTWRTLNLNFPGAEGRSSDLESACRIPGNGGYLFAESGQEGDADRRIFHAVYGQGTLKIKSHINWPVPIRNVEATEVCKVGHQLIFLYAERADSQPATKLRWAPLTLNPLKIGNFQEVTYQGVDPVGTGARPIVALDVDSQGFLYSVSAYDSGSDDGPYRSVVWKIGKVSADQNGNPCVKLGTGERIADLDGLKVESIVVRETDAAGRQIFIGTDDEHYGGILRLLPQ